MTPRKPNPVPLGGFVGVFAILVTLVFVAAKIPADGWAHSWPWALVLAPVLVVYGFVILVAALALVLGVYGPPRPKPPAPEMERFEIFARPNGRPLVRDHLAGVDYHFHTWEAAARGLEGIAAGDLRYISVRTPDHERRAA